VRRFLLQLLRDVFHWEKAEQWLKVIHRSMNKAGVPGQPTKRLQECAKKANFKLGDSAGDHDSGPKSLLRALHSVAPEHYGRLFGDIRPTSSEAVRQLRVLVADQMKEDFVSYFQGVPDNPWLTHIELGIRDDGWFDYVALQVGADICRHVLPSC
jgi:hypothetical protein